MTTPSPTTAEAQSRLPSSAAAAYNGPPRDHEVQVQVITFNGADIEEHGILVSPEALRQAAIWRRPDRVTWMHIDGLHDAKVVAALGETFDLHGLAVEDIVTLDTRAKADDYGLSVVINIKQLRLGKGIQGELTEEHVSLVLGERWVLSFQELPPALFSGVRARLLASRGRLRRQGADYLLHSLLNAIIDDYREIADRFADQVDAVEDWPTDRFDEGLPAEVHRLKAQLQAFRRAARPVREALGVLAHARPELVHKSTLPYYRDLQTHINEVIELVESLRERLDDTLDLHLALASHRMNDTMRILTVVTTIFIPLSFIAGVYGMNFAHMPELQSRWGYPVVLSLMAATAIGLLWRFRRAGWI